ncbi:MAG: hypothetical protein JO200_14245 [Comamonas sp.]|nr:hypothetical protein [Comamonas sp.]
MVHKASSLFVWILVGIAVALVAAAAVDMFSAPRRLLGMTLVSLDAAYFMVLAENWVSGRSVQTRGGLIDRRTSPVAYFFVYFLLVVAGLIGLVVFLSALVLGG